MELSVQEYQYLVSEITRETGAKRDGSGKNLIVPRCPFCGKSGGKFGIYIGKATAHRRPFMAHCFSCGASTRTLEQLLAAIGRMDLMVLQTADIAAPLNLHLLETVELIGGEKTRSLGSVILRGNNIILISPVE